MEATHFEGKQEILHPEGGYGQPMKVDIHEYEEVTRNLSELEPKIVPYESTNEEKPVHSTSDSTIPPPPPAPPILSTTHEKEEAGGGTGSGVSLRSASKTLPCADEPTASIPYQTIDDIVNNLQHSIDLLVTAGKIDRNTSHNHNEKHSAEHSKESKTRGFFSLPWIKNRPMSEASKAPPIKDLPKEKATSLSSSSTKDVPATVPSPKDPKILIPITEFEHDFVFIPSNKEEEKEKKILDKMEKRERALAKKVASTESKLASLRTQIEKHEAELEIERQSVKDADAEILSKRYDLLLLKEKGDKERAERERIEKEHTEKEKTERERNEAERIRAMKEEVRGDLDEIGHAQTKEVGH